VIGSEEIDCRVERKNGKNKEVEDTKEEPN
jgi:hypothetical protein